MFHVLFKPILSRIAFRYSARSSSAGVCRGGASRCSPNRSKSHRLRGRLPRAALFGSPRRCSIGRRDEKKTDRGGCREADGDVRGAAGIAGEHRPCNAERQSAVFFIFFVDIRARLRLANTYLKFPKRVWPNARRSDETEVELFARNSKRYIRRKNNTARRRSYGEARRRHRASGLFLQLELGP